MKFLHHSYKKSSNKVATDISTSGGFWGKYDVGELYLNIRADSLHPMWRTCGNVKRFLDDVKEIWLLFHTPKPERFRTYPVCTIPTTATSNKLQYLSHLFDPTATKPCVFWWLTVHKAMSASYPYFSYPVDHNDPRVRHSFDGFDKVEKIIHPFLKQEITSPLLRQLGDKLAPTKKVVASAKKVIRRVVGII